MKNLIITLTLLLTHFLSYSQQQFYTPVDVYVINNQNCPYFLTDTYSGPNGAGSMTLLSVDTTFGDVYHYAIYDSIYPITVTVCLYVGSIQPPAPGPIPQCITQVLNSGASLTFSADCSILGIESLTNNTDKNILKVVDLNGKECQIEKGKYLIIYYTDETFDKVYIND